MLGFVMTLAAVLLAAVALFESSSVQSVVSVCLSVGLCILASLWLPPVLAKGNLYMFLASVSQNWLQSIDPRETPICTKD
jgi:H+/Cl- antiporter ClcA